MRDSKAVRAQEQAEEEVRAKVGEVRAGAEGLRLCFPLEDFLGGSGGE